MGEWTYALNLTAAIKMLDLKRERAGWKSFWNLNLGLLCWGKRLRWKRRKATMSLVKASKKWTNKRPKQAMSLASTSLPAVTSCLQGRYPHPHSLVAVELTQTSLIIILMQQCLWENRAGAKWAVSTQESSLSSEGKKGGKKGTWPFSDRNSSSACSLAAWKGCKPRFT